MSLRNSPHKNEASTGCVRETPQNIKKKKEKKKANFGCVRNSRQKIKASVGCVREAPQIKMKPERDVYEKLPI